MGYQESLIYIQPQEQVGQIVKEYLMARQQDPSGRFLADIPAAVRLQAPLKGCPAGSVLLWAAGERSNNMLQAAMPGRLETARILHGAHDPGGGYTAFA